MLQRDAGVRVGDEVSGMGQGEELSCSKFQPIAHRALGVMKPLEESRIEPR